MKIYIQEVQYIVLRRVTSGVFQVFSETFPRLRVALWWRKEQIVRGMIRVVVSRIVMTSSHSGERESKEVSAKDSDRMLDVESWDMGMTAAMADGKPYRCQ